MTATWCSKNSRLEWVVCVCYGFKFLLCKNHSVLSGCMSEMVDSKYIHICHIDNKVKKNHTHTLSCTKLEEHWLKYPWNSRVCCICDKVIWSVKLQISIQSVAIFVIHTTPARCLIMFGVCLYTRLSKFKRFNVYTTQIGYSVNVDSFHLQFYSNYLHPSIVMCMCCIVFLFSFGCYDCYPEWVGARRMSELVIESRNSRIFDFCSSISHRMGEKENSA